MKKEIKSRTYNSILNSLVGILTSAVTIILNFVVRIVIVQQLGEEINGIHSLFQSITNALTLIETGFSTAMVIHLYKPVKEENHHETRAILKFYKKIYVIIAILFALICIVINTFFIQYLVKSSLPLSKVRFYFAIFMMITPFSYLTYYKVSVLYAEQKNRVRFVIASACEVVFRTLQIISAFIFREYYVFLILLIAEKVTCNLLCSWYVNRENEYIKEKNSDVISEETKKEIFKTVKPILVNNIAFNTQTSAKSILISILLGNVSVVGYFGNYQLVSSTAQVVFSQFGGALTSSFGNLAVEGDSEHMYYTYRKVIFVLDWIAILMCSGFICCIQPFILMCFGKNFVLPFSVVLVITVELFFYLLNVPIISIQNAMGLHREDQKVMVCQAIVAVILGYVLGKYIGMIGILLGLLMPEIICTLIHKGIVINKKAFGKSTGDFLKVIGIEILKGAIVITLSYAIAAMISTGNLLVDFLLKGIVAVIINVAMFLVSSCKDPYFKAALKMLKR